MRTFDVGDDTDQLLEPSVTYDVDRDTVALKGYHDRILVYGLDPLFVSKLSYTLVAVI